MRPQVGMFAIATLLFGILASVAFASPIGRGAALQHPQHSAGPASGSGTLTTLYAFNGQPDGSVPEGGVLIDASGNVFGNTAYGGANGSGSIYELTPSGSSYTEHVILSYSSIHDGTAARGTLATDKNGNIFGMAPYGGHNNSSGTAVELTPLGGAAYNESTVHSFTGSDGAVPFGGLVRNGSLLYATTYDGGIYGNGTVVSLQGNKLKSSVQYSFGAQQGDGTGPNSRLFLAPDGSYYSTTLSALGSGAGTVFKFDASRGGVVKLFTFTDSSTGVAPNGVTVDKSGNIYGTASQGGSAGIGLLYKLTPSGSGYVEQILHSFTGTSADGGFPQGTLVLAGKTLYGTTTTGGSGCGTIFSVQTNGKKYATVHDVNCQTEGGGANGDLLWANGAIFGVLASGGSGNNGSVYKFVP